METGIKDIIGKTLVSIEKDCVGNLLFETESGDRYIMGHTQDCCESVAIEDINGDLSWLVGSPILVAEESNNSTDEARDKCDESWTWTFYRFATIKGHVVIRWYGSSNGYYSESVDFTKL